MMSCAWLPFQIGYRAATPDRRRRRSGADSSCHRYGLLPMLPVAETRLNVFTLKLRLNEARPTLGALPVGPLRVNRKFFCPVAGGAEPALHDCLIGGRISRSGRSPY